MNCIKADDTRVKINTLSDKINYAENIYDVVVAFFDLIDDTNTSKYIYTYNSEMELGSGLNDKSKRVTNLLYQVVEEQIDFEHFKLLLWNELESEQDDYDKMIFFSIHFLTIFDLIAGEKEKYSLLNFDKRITLTKDYEVGPLNKVDDQYFFYFKLDKSFEDLCEIISDTRKFKAKNLSDFNSRLCHYQIVPKIKGSPIVKIKQYNNCGFDDFSDIEKKISIAVVPFVNKSWFSLEKEEFGEENYFSVLYKEEYRERINNNYIKTLEVLNEKGVEVVVFPEMSMNKETEKIIRRWLAEKTLTESKFNIKLVCLGSVWIDNKNECYMLSGTGTILAKNLKKIGFELEEDGKKYVEKILEGPSEYQLVDIPYIGRILYLICRDALEDLDQTIYWNKYDVNIEVISAYSRSIKYFEECMERFIKQKRGLAVVANCCEPRLSVNAEDIGFLVIPKGEKRDTYIELSADFHSYGVMEKCASECDFCDCIHIYNIYPKKKVLRDEYIGMYVEHNILTK